MAQCVEQYDGMSRCLIVIENRTIISVYGFFFRYYRVCVLRFEKGLKSPYVSTVHVHGWYLLRSFGFSEFNGRYDLNVNHFDTTDTLIRCTSVEYYTHYYTPMCEYTSRLRCVQLAGNDMMVSLVFYTLYESPFLLYTLIPLSHGPVPSITSAALTPTDARSMLNAFVQLVKLF